MELKNEIRNENVKTQKKKPFIKHKWLFNKISMFILF